MTSSILPKQAVLSTTNDAWLRHAALDAMASDPRRKPNWLRDRSAKELTALRAFAARNQVAPIVAHAVLDVWADAKLPDREAWRRIHDESASRMRVLSEELDRVAERLKNHGMAMVALKNAGIARGIYPCPACCPMGDVDVLIDRDRFRDAHRLLEECGFELSSRSKVEPADLEQNFLAGGAEYVRRVNGEEVWLELQWRPIAGRWIRPDQEPDGSSLIARSVAIHGSAVRLLEPTDNMLQVCLHTAKHSYLRAPGLRLHTDVDRIARFTPPDWNAVVRKAHELQITTATYFSLALSRALLDATVPDHVVHALAPPQWKIDTIAAWLRKADLFEPAKQKFSRPEMLLFHALLYDDAQGLLASVLGTSRNKLGPRHVTRNFVSGVRRLMDVVTRYQP